MPDSTPTPAAELAPQPAASPSARPAPTPASPGPVSAPAAAPVAPAVPPPPYDAILVPHMYPPGKTDTDLLLARKTEFLPLLRPYKGGTLVFSHEVAGQRPQKDILRLGNKGGEVPPNTGFFFDSFHPSRAGEERYAWTDRGDGVLYGVLVPDDTTDSVLADARKAFQTAQEAFQRTPEGKAQRLAQIDALVASGALEPGLADTLKAEVSSA